jgi:hypothetical protein
MPDKPTDPFDDIFEPFDLEDASQRGEEHPTTQRRTVEVRTDDPPPSPTGGEPSGIICASCGTLNHVANRHCDNCGARLVRSQMPVAPQPMLRTTAGARALIVLASVVLAVALLALMFNVVGGETEVPSTTEPTETTLAAPVVELEPLRIECTSELASFPCSALIDGDPTTSWNATDGGVGAEIIVFFQPPVQITDVWVQNLTDEGRFLRNARIKGIEVSIDDRPQLTIQELADSQDVQQVRLQSLRTSRVVVRITSSHPGIAYEGQEPFNELALQAITFFGRVTPGE